MTPKYIIIILLLFTFIHTQGQHPIESFFKLAENPEFAKDTTANEKLYAVSLMSPNSQITSWILAHGNIREIHIKAYDANMKFGNIEKNTNSVRLVDVYLYNDSLRLYYKTPNKKLTEKYYFDDFGLYQLSTYRNNRLQKISKFEFNTIGNNTEINTYDAKNRMCGKCIHIYNKEKRCINKNVYNSHGDLSVQYEFEYDLQRRLSKQIKTTKENGHTTSVFTYHKNGLCSKRIDTNPNDTNVVVYQYDNRNNCISKVTSSENTAYCYDNRDNVIEDLSFNSNGEFLNRLDISYEYDFRGNWTRLICVSEFSKTGIILERQIIYQK